MTDLGRRRESPDGIASEPIRPSTLVLGRRASKIAELEKLRQSCNELAGPSTIDYEVDEIRDTIRSKALDEDFSVAIRERWQTWSRNANPFRSKLASSAASDLKMTDHSVSDSDDPDEDSAAEDASDQDAEEPPPKKKRGRVARGARSKTKNGTSDLDITEEWDAIRRQRETFLTDMDVALPKAFRYSERQMKVYAHRLKTKYVNSLDRPFEAKEVHRLLRRSELPDSSAPGPSRLAGTQATTATSQLTVFAISMFSSSIDWTKEAAAAKGTDDPRGSTSDADGDNTRDDYVKRICGDGLGGMRRAQTVELLSTQTLSDLHSSLVCWSDEQPERCDWRDRLRRYVEHRSTAEQPDEPAPPAAPFADDDEAQDARFTRFTGRRRQTDAAFIIEDKLYVKGIRHGDAAFEADYATLIDEWKRCLSISTAAIASICNGGDFDQRLDQIDSIRVGQPYWLLHQGDCVHCLVVDQVRALRPSEERALRQGITTSDIESAAIGTGFVPFPRITWLCTPTMLRFAADDKHNYGLGHHILRWEDSLPLAHTRISTENRDEREAGASQGESSVPNPWQVAHLRTRRKDEGLLRRKQGKCLACSWRKAQVGILGGERVRLPLASTATNEEVGTRDEPALDGLDEYLISICTPCAAILGLPTRPPDAHGVVELDWQRIDSDKDRQAGWAVFPMY